MAEQRYVPNVEERIMTLHPQGKSGDDISKQQHNVMREAILDSAGPWRDYLYGPDRGGTAQA